MLCDKALTKQPDGLLVKALKALSLDLLDRREDSASVCREVREARPDDLAVLRTLSTVYENQGRGRSMQR